MWGGGGAEKIREEAKSEKTMERKTQEGMKEQLGRETQEP